MQTRQSFFVFHKKSTQEKSIWKFPCNFSQKKSTKKFLAIQMVMNHFTEKSDETKTIAVDAEMVFFVIVEWATHQKLVCDHLTLHLRDDVKFVPFRSFSLVGSFSSFSATFCLGSRFFLFFESLETFPW